MSPVMTASHDFPTCPTWDARGQGDATRLSVAPAWRAFIHRREARDPVGLAIAHMLRIMELVFFDEIDFNARATDQHK